MIITCSGCGRVYTLGRDAVVQTWGETMSRFEFGSRGDSDGTQDAPDLVDFSQNPAAPTKQVGTVARIAAQVTSGSIRWWQCKPCQMVQQYPPSTSRPKLGKKFSRILAWAVTLGLLYYVFRSISFTQIMVAFGSAAAWSVPAFVLLVLGVYLGDCFAIWKTFGWFVARLSFREVLVVRGATYLLALVNYTVGQGAIVYFVNRSRGVPLLRGTAAVLLIMGTNILLLLVFASVGLLIAPDLPPALRRIMLGAYVALAVYFVLLVLRPRWLTSRPIFDVLFAAGVSGHLRALLVRVPHISVLMVFTYTSLRAFGIQVPVAQAILYLPVIYFISVLPIAVMGLGTTQAALIYFLSGYVPGASPAAAKAAIVAASLGAQAVALVVQATLGALCLRNQLARDLRRPASTT